MVPGATPSIAAIGILGKHDNPLYITHFPPHTSSSDSASKLTWLIFTCLDVFALRRDKGTLTQDLGLLQAFDDRLAAYGHLTNTEIKFVIIVDMEGRPPLPGAGAAGEEVPPSLRRYPPVVGLRDADLKPAFRAVHQAYIGAMLNPFYAPDDRKPVERLNHDGGKVEIKGKKFEARIRRIGEGWAPGVTSL